MTDNCPVCGRERYFNTLQMGRPHDHLDCVRQLKLSVDGWQEDARREAENSLFWKQRAENSLFWKQRAENSLFWKQRAEQAEAEVARLKWMLREVEAGATIDAAERNWKEAHRD